MLKRHKGEARTYEDERQRLLIAASTLHPVTEEYETVMARLDDLDKISKRSSEKLKVVIPACITAASLVGIYAVQQFAGVVVPRAMDAITSRSHKNQPEKD